MKKLLLLFVLSLSSFSFYGQQIDLFAQFNGHYDYTALGNTLNASENNSGYCDILTESSADLNLDPQQSLVSAMLYWSGSATGDFDVKLNGSVVSAQRTFSHVFNGQIYFAAYADVTSIVETQGNGTYTFSDMDISNTINQYCGTNYGGWSIIVVYEDPSLLLNQVAIFDGLESVSANNNSLNITLDNISAISDLLSKIGFLAWEGDQQLAVAESLFINNFQISNPPLNPGNNAFNGTNSYTNSNQLYNMDLDYYELTGIVQPGDTQIDIQLTSQQDFIMVNNIVTVINSELPDGTVVIDGVVISPLQDELEVTYTVSNVNSTNFLPANTSITFFADNVLIAEEFTNQDLQIGETVTEEVTISIPIGTPDNFILRAVIDGNGEIRETDEDNNEFSFPINNGSIIINPPVVNLRACDDNNDGFQLFDISLQDDVIILGNPNLSVTYHATLVNAQNGVLPVNNIYENDKIYLDAPIIDSQDPNYGTGGIWARVENSANSDINIFPFALEVRSSPVGNTPEPLRVCDDDYDGLAVFNLTVVENEVLGSLNPTGFDLYYYQDFGDATTAGDMAATNPDFSQAISDPSFFFNLINPQIIYILLVSNSSGTIPPNPNSAEGCYDIVELSLNVDPKPIDYGPFEMVLCDDELQGSSPYDGVSTFDLTVNNPIISGGDPSFTVEWFLTNQDEEANLPITNPTAFQNINSPQTVISRVTSGFGCKTLVTLTLVVLPIPSPNVNPTPLEVCDDNNDGFSVFDLTIKDAEILNGQEDVQITYHETLAEAEAGISGTELVSPYINIVPFNQVVYARVANLVPPNQLPCYTIVELELIVSELPQITEPENLFIDEGDGDGLAIFNLTVNIDVMLAGLNPADYTISFYTSLADALSNVNSIIDATSYANVSNPQTIFVRVENVNTSCYVVTSFEILTDELAPDADGDGISNEDEDINNNGNLNDDDTDGDGIPNYLDTDDDGDTVLTIDETTGIGAGFGSSYIYIDTDGDNIENYLDNDDDGDDTLTIDEDYNNNGNPIDDDINDNDIPDFLDDEVFLSVNSFGFDDLSMYPNPTSESFTIQSSKLVSETTISVFDIQGKTLISEKMLPQNGKLIMEVSSLEKGVYFVKISSEGNSIVKKLLKN